MEPITRKEMFLAGAAGEEVPQLTPVTRTEMFLAKAAGRDVPALDPVTREEWFINQIQGGGGGGGSGYSLIGSGSYTHSGSAVANLQIPVSYTGSIKYAYCIAVGITGVAHSGCFVCIDDLDFNQFFAGGHIGLVTEVDANDTVVNFLKNDSNRIDDNIFTLSRAANAYMIQPGTYNWFIYGEE